MWILLELLTGLMPTFLKIKKEYDIRLFWLTILCLLGACFSVLYLKNIMLTLLVIIGYIFYRLISFVKYYDRQYGNYDKRDFVNLPSINLIEYKEKFKINYQDMLQKEQKRWQSQLQPFVNVVFQTKAGGTYLLINDIKLLSKELSHFKMVFFGIIYQQKIKDSQGQIWSLKLRIWGTFRLTVTLIVKKEKS